MRNLKALIYGEKQIHVLDALGFLESLKNLTGESIESIAIISQSKDEINAEELMGASKVYALGAVSSYASFNSVLKLYNELSPDLLLGAATKNTNEVLARMSAKLDIPMLTEVTELEKVNGDIILRRNMLGGRALISYVFSKPLILTVPQKKFKPPEEGPVPEVEEYKAEEEAKVRVVEVKPKEKGAVDIEAAEIIVGVGRGFKNKDDLNIAFELASLLGGEVGCTRPIAADYGWLGEDRWIGISGKKIRGKLYFAIGISGAPQHIMAANDSKIIVAVNKDKNAPIFQYADYGIVADLYQFLPVLIKRLKERT